MLKNDYHLTAHDKVIPSPSEVSLLWKVGISANYFHTVVNFHLQSQNSVKIFRIVKITPILKYKHGQKIKTNETKTVVSFVSHFQLSPALNTMKPGTNDR